MIEIEVSNPSHRRRVPWEDTTAFLDVVVRFDPQPPDLRAQKWGFDRGYADCGAGLYSIELAYNYCRDSGFDTLKSESVLLGYGQALQDWVIAQAPGLRNGN